MRDGLHNDVLMTNDEAEQIRKYLGKIRRNLYDFSIDAASRRAELPKLEEIITEVMVASVEPENEIDRVILHHLETRAKHCRTIILKLLEM